MRLHSRLVLFALPLLFLFLFFPTRAFGADLYFGYSRLSANTFNPNTEGLHGWEAAGHFHILPFIGLEADVSHYGLGADSNVAHSTAVMGGPRVTVGLIGAKFFVHALLGVEHSNNAGNVFDSNAFAVAAGGGVDIPIVPFFAWRINADYIQAPTRDNTSSHNRFGTGLVFRF